MVPTQVVFPKSHPLSTFVAQEFPLAGRKTTRPISGTPGNFQMSSETLVGAEISPATLAVDPLYDRALPLFETITATLLALMSILMIVA